MDLEAVWLTFKLATATTVILAALGLPLAYWLALTEWRGRRVLEAVVALPLVLPPTVIGFYLLWALGPSSPLGRAYESATSSLLPFSFNGILLGAVLCNLPIAVRPFLSGFSGMSRRLVEASWCLGESWWMSFWRVAVPVCWPNILTGLILTFAHTVGEFGVVLMVGGNIPRVTRTLSIAIYDDVQALNYEAANRTALGLVVFALLALLAIQLLADRRQPR